MNKKTRGIVLQSTNYSETSLVVKIYTEQYGLESYIVSGVRTKKSRFSSNIFQPLSLVELVASGRTGSTLKRITDIQLSPAFSGIPGDVIKSTIALFLSEVIYRSIREEEHNPALFGFLHNSIQILDLSQDNCARFHLYFMIQLTRYLGFFPQGECNSNGRCFDLKEGVFTDYHSSHIFILDHENSLLLYRLMNSGFETYRDIVIPAPRMRTILDALVTYFEIHHTHGNPIRSHTILGEVLQ